MNELLLLILLLLFETKCDNVKTLYRQIDEIAPHNINVLLQGESGTGKEVFADLLQSKSDRKNQPYIKLNCTALPETMIESELFGHEKGAFTGAHSHRIGKFEQANGGTLLLDELGDAALSTQAKILRVIENKNFSRLGGNREIQTDVRIIATTNKNIESAIQDGSFRLDLFYRFGAFLLVPSVSQRQADVESFLENFRYWAESELNKQTLGFSPEARHKLVNHCWVGNLREMQHVVKRAVLSTPANTPINIEYLTIRCNGRGTGIAEAKVVETDELLLKKLKNLNLDAIEGVVIKEALERSSYLQKLAAVKLGISPRALNYKIKDYGITHRSWKKNVEHVSGSPDKVKSDKSST